MAIKRSIAKAVQDMTKAHQQKVLANQVNVPTTASPHGWMKYWILSGIGITLGVTLVTSFIFPRRVVVYESGPYQGPKKEYYTSQAPYGQDGHPGSSQ